eukprot:4046326-Pleurochrysis_carterae.AAC.1
MPCASANDLRLVSKGQRCLRTSGLGAKFDAKSIFLKFCELSSSFYFVAACLLFSTTKTESAFSQHAMPQRPEKRNFIDIATISQLITLLEYKLALLSSECFEPSNTLKYTRHAR